MYTLKKIDKLLLKSDQQNLDEYFVAAACEINAIGQAKHVGLIIHCNEGYFLFHYEGGETVELEEDPIDIWYFHKAFDFILPEFCGDFLGHCKKIQENAKPIYGFFYPGSYYSDGVYYSENQLPEYMTCVGFCINVVKGFIEADEFFAFEDWNAEDIDQEYIDSMIAKIQIVNPNITAESIAENIRRIRPTEFISSAFINEYPIRKEAIDVILALVTQVIKGKRVSAINPVNLN